MNAHAMDSDLSSGVVSHGGKRFYCCECGFGPMEEQLYAQCIGCNWHQPCANCTWESLDTESAPDGHVFCGSRENKFHGGRRETMIIGNVSTHNVHARLPEEELGGASQ
ncbi:uncharacterized protein BKCO1_5000038 [Diplodia corticola]|uniref:Uncharacterized protein n=1 Tax=Diplodia corticola TaxID=236234 RepID=A0A1J9RTS1_9PEZI|nr:uncharacterized protein BKCO1_5000038 [Diplodia corticola]OJD31268.1 hypothetical protein BKCO1_5000038 [Diplodia corticola]